MPLLYRMLAFPMVVAAFASLPRKVNFGPISGMGVLTILEVALIGVGLLTCHRYPRRLLLRTLPYLGFMAWVAASPLWAPPQFSGIQNALVYFLFGLMVLFAGTLAARNVRLIESLIDRGMLWIDCVALGFVALELLFHGLPKDTEEGWWIGPRPTAILGLIVISHHLARWYYGDKRSRIWILLWISAIVVSVSRSATAIALGLVGLVVLAQIRFRLRRAALSGPAVAGAFLAVLMLAVYWQPLHDHMFAGDTKLQLGGTSINVSGRLAMWTAVVESARDRPLTGKGLGSAQQVVSTTFQFTQSQMSQPHDDYLRIWHDVGAIGLGLYLLAAVGWMWLLGREWYDKERAGIETARLEFTAFLALLALSLVEVTDNPVVYQTVMGTAGLLVGAGLGARAYRQTGLAREQVPNGELPTAVALGA